MTKSKIYLTLLLFFFAIYVLTGQGSIQSEEGKTLFLLTQAMLENQTLSFLDGVSLEDDSGPHYSKYGLGASVLAIP